jgi:FlaA1/EpsC-like NDP-sugar epimerase
VVRSLLARRTDLPRNRPAEGTVSVNRLIQGGRMTGHTFAHRLRAHRTPVLMVFDGLALLASYYLAMLLRYSSAEVAAMTSRVAVIGAAAVIGQCVAGMISRVYHGRVAVASIEETILLGVTTVSAGLVLGFANMLSEPYIVARSVPFTATFMGLVVMGVGRAMWRQEADRVYPRISSSRDPALVLGAGRSGQSLVQSMLTAESSLWPVGFLDDDPWKRHRKHYGVPVLGTLENIAAASCETGARTVVIAIPCASAELVKEVSDRSRALGLAVKVLPPLVETFSTRVDIRDVRDIEVRDLLGRSAVETDIDSIAGYLMGRRVLVTGAGGSIGSELCRQIDRWGPEELIMLDRDESALHAVQLSLRGRALLDSPDLVLNDIRDDKTVLTIFRERRPQVVFHAAALKHLPMLEQYPGEAIKTNVWGTLSILEGAKAAGVERFVNISTDKAANPVSVLGYSKRLAEGLTAAVAREASGTFLSVRFGNVLGSRGSVLTAFAAQVAAGGPVTVTDPDVTRYFMTVHEAVQLVIQAGAIGRDGEAVVLDMGQPVSIDAVARQLIVLSGRPIDVVYTGLRDGEKLHEVMFGDGELDERPVHPLISHTPVPPYSTLDARALDPWKQKPSDITEALAAATDRMLGDVVSA